MILKSDLQFDDLNLGFKVQRFNIQWFKIRWFKIFFILQQSISCTRQVVKPSQIIWDEINGSCVFRVFPRISCQKENTFRSGHCIGGTKADHQKLWISNHNNCCLMKNLIVAIIFLSSRWSAKKNYKFKAWQHWHGFGIFFTSRQKWHWWPGFKRAWTITIIPKLLLDPVKYQGFLSWIANKSPILGSFDFCH